MGNRLSKIVTRTGDDGTTGLGDGSRTIKNGPRIHAIGEVDELNSMLGVVLAETLPDEIRAALVEIQHDLFDLGGELAVPGMTMVTDDHLARVEACVEQFNAELAPLKEFILPGGTRAAAHMHLARTVCRRAERATVALAAGEALAALPRQYLNRLSDLLFILGRVLNKRAGSGDVLWRHRRTQG